MQSAWVLKLSCSLKKFILLASGKNKAEAIYKAVYGSVRPDAPASILQLHQDVVVIVDKDAALYCQKKIKRFL